MKYIRFSSLALCGAMLLSLAACGGDAAPTPSAPADTVVTAAPSAPAAPEATAPAALPEVSDEPAATPEAAVPVESKSPEETQKPVQTQPVQTQPAETAPAPSDAPAVNLSASSVYDKVAAVAGGNPMTDASFVLEDFYDISDDDLEDFVLAMPDMSAAIEEVLVAKVKSGKMDAVKAACQGRQQRMAEDAAMYPATGGYVESYQLITNGDWLLFCVCENASAAADAFNGCTK